MSRRNQGRNRHQTMRRSVYWRNAAVKYQLLVPDFSRVHDCLNVDDSIYSSMQRIMRRRVVSTERHKLMPDLGRVYCNKQR